MAGVVVLLAVDSLNINIVRVIVGTICISVLITVTSTIIVVTQ